MNKPRLEDFIKEIPWTDSQGKEYKAAGIDFASYAFALEKYIRELEKKQSSPYPCGKTEMDAKCPDCLDHFDECAKKSRAEPKPSLEDYRKQIKDDKCSCGYVGLSKLRIEHYDHDGGWPVEGFEEKQWLYVTCPKCGYQWALWKLGIPR